MQTDSLSPMQRETRSDWVRLRTLIKLRWMAIAGQLAAIAIAQRYFHMVLPLGPCYLAVGTAVIANLIAIYVFPESKRLTEGQALLTLLFDLMQLTFLLFLTGGLNNPFALLLVAPVAIAAAALEARTTMVLAFSAVCCVSLVAAVHLPLYSESGVVLTVPGTFEFGFWLSIVIGIVFIGLYAHRVASEIYAMSDALAATQMALSREQKLTDLGGVVAAAAHELGTPLATIKLVSSELIDELGDLPELQEDARLIREQADRCRDILRSMGRAGKDDLLMRVAPLSAVIREAAEPHLERGKAVHFGLQKGFSETGQPTIMRKPEVIHGVRNLVQNAVDFARHEVWVDIAWNATSITLRIVDDGAGFPSQIIRRIGDPYVRRRQTEQDLAQRPEYEGMGLGLFIAKTLLERSGAELTFANGADPFLTEAERPARSGAIVEVVWPRNKIEAAANTVLGENRRFSG